MPKGIFTQGVCVLTNGPVSLDELESVLGEFQIRGRIEETESWVLGGPSLTLEYLPKINELVAIDIVDRQWPDDMSDTEDEKMIFAGWAMGQFGPFAYPGGLNRAAEQCWAWKGGQTMPDQHKGFIRIRASYAFGAGLDDPVMPGDYDAMPELEFVTKITSAVLDLPAALCYFNPNGEILRDQNGRRECLNFGWSNDLPPLDIWSNVRLFTVDAEWSLMDTVGNGQLNVRDTEVCFHAESYDMGEIDNFLRNISLYTITNGEVINDGDTMDGPGGIRWQARHYASGVCEPPRRVLRWFPKDDREVPTILLEKGREETDEEEDS
jgi:hypothetical protein